MSDFFDFLDDDPDYDGQGKSRQQETEGSLRVVGCLLLLVAFFVALFIATLVVWAV
jgi:hypothetical protein